MITANDIREVKFAHTLGGYKTAEVDEFLDRCADCVEELTKQNAENEKKMQVLAESVMDYRNQEDSIRSALISAQRMSESVIGDARKQAEEILNSAKEEAEKMHEKALADTAAEQNELVRVRREVADFKARLLSTYREHLTLIGVLEDADDVPAPAEPAAPAPEAEEADEAAAPVIKEPAEEEAPAQPTAYAAYRSFPNLADLELPDEDEDE